MNIRIVVAVILAGGCGALATVLAAGILSHPALLLIPLANPELMVFAVALAALIPLACRLLPGVRGLLLALVPLLLGGQMVGVLLEDRDLADGNLLPFSLIYAVTTVLLYRLVAGPAKAARVASGPPEQG
ncbi:hypothetical protein AAFN88_04660 [Pelagibius sp. CAU 1746]|uniref:hypothetical protein n=1 Tax=Pelagibius sp. CAU 1746 TaxID=3140370 RepID=UPI00325B9D5C